MPALSCSPSSGFNDLVLQHLIERRAESPADLPSAVEELLDQVVLNKLST